MPGILRLLLLAQIFTTFLTGTKLVPGIRNNFGPFEVIGVLLCLAFLGYHGKELNRRRLHPILRILILITVAAAVSLLTYNGGSLPMGLIQTMILVFLLVFVFVLYNLMLIYQISPEQILRLVTYSALIIGPWVLFSGLAADGDIQAAGPFRNRAHMANYMLTAFWLVLLYNSWPGIAKREKFISYLALVSTLYPIAAAGRRSVYLSLILGLIVFGMAFLVAFRGRRGSAIAATLVVFAIIGGLYSIGPRWLPQLEFFQSRVGGISERLESVSSSFDDDSADRSFFSWQRIGVMQAFRSRPLLGIGWGGFYKSLYSPTGHEVHSTPMRFLAELGLIGLGLYVALMGVLLIGSLRILALVRRTAYRMPAMVLAIAVWSLSVSYLYNRHITERTFWLLLVFYLSFEAFVRSLAARQRQATESAIAVSTQRHRPRAAAVAALPRLARTQRG